MRKNLPSILVAVPLSFLVFVSACSSGSSYSNPNANSAPQPPAAPPAQIVVSDCGKTISSPGTYSLNSSLTTSSDVEPCITIANTNNVTLNCNGNSITGVSDYGGISALHVSSLIIKNCTVATGDGQATSPFLSLNHVDGATVTGSTFGSNQSNLGAVFITDSTNVTFGAQLPSAPVNPSVTTTTNPSISGQISNAPPPSNTVYGFLDDANNVNLVIEGNALTSGTSTDLNPFVIGIFGGQNTHVLNNTVNGLGNPILIEENGIWGRNGTGSDDDILIEDETGPGSSISGNLLVNTFDCGIETVGFMKNIILSDNYIDTVANGFGGWDYLSVTNAQYVQNVLTNIQYAGFLYYRVGGLRPAGAQNQFLPYFFYEIPADMPAETTINFTQNQFIGNSLSQPIVSRGYPPSSFFALVYSAMAYTPTVSLPGTEPTLQQFITLNNIFTNNNFDTAFGPFAVSGGAPWTYTSNDVIDGKGNICSGSQTWVPAVSPTFADQQGPIIWASAINCGSGN